MNAGRLDKRVTLRTITQAPNDSGDVVDTPSTLATVWAEMKFLKGRELVEAQSLYSEVQCQFTIRYSLDVSALSSKHDILVGSDVYDILGDPIPVRGGRPERLVIYTKRRE